jgi:predicted anti-sigma-YlaC factor YlaD
VSFCERDMTVLAVHALGALEEDERLPVEEHLDSCELCRAELDSLAVVRDALDLVPPEAWLEGPPDGGELMLRRMLRTVRAERTSWRLPRRTVGVAAAVVLTVVAAGALVGRITAPVAAARTVAAAPAPPVPGTRVGSVTDAATGARLTVRVEPAAGWVRVSAAVTGVPAGQRCRLVVVGRDGQHEIAGSWLVSAKGAADGTVLSGAALVAPQQVAAVRVENVDGQQFVSVSV